MTEPQALGPMHGTARLYLFHDNPNGNTKAWLDAHGEALTAVDASKMFDPETSRMVCLVDGATDHAAAAICYDVAEARRFLTLSGVVSKDWYLVPLADLLLACPELTDHPWAELPE